MESPTLIWRQFILPFYGGARLTIPAKLGGSSEPELFARELSAAMDDIRRLVYEAGARWIAGPTSLLSLPQQVATDLVRSFPEIRGTNLGPIFAWLHSVFGYFGWRVESGEAYNE